MEMDISFASEPTTHVAEIDRQSVCTEKEIGCRERDLEALL
jgi:hypothetical protein